MRSTLQPAAGLVVALSISATQAAETITTASLINEMVDLSRLTRFPDPAYTNRQFSSYDRAAKSPTENWFANGDRGHYLRVEEKDGRKEYVMVDTDGPGAIVRIWSANPQGTLKIYIDGNETPALEAPMTHLLDGRVAGIPKPISGQRSRGWNLYLPIPYAKHCKIASTQGNFYYQVNYRTYAAGTPVESFSAEQLKTLADQIHDVSERLASPRAGAAPPAERERESFDIDLEPGQEESMYLSGPAAIVGLLFSEVEAADRDAALRSIILSISFDGHDTVEVPLGDFYGAAPGVNPYASLPLGVTEDGELWCHWRMPFKDSAELTAKNLGKQTVRIAGAVSYVPYEWDEASMHFHAKWRIERDIPTDPKRDWTYLSAAGKGRYVGDALFIANPVRQWWGEGDEKIYVDGETFPSHFGTGTEDYYGYAWGCNERFTHAYHNQPRCDGPGNYGFTSVNRWHIIDDIPFTRDFKFDIEVWHSRKCKMTYAATAYWYAMPESTDDFKPITEADVPLPDIPEYKIFRVEGALEGEAMFVLVRSGNTQRQELGDTVSNERHLWWTGAKPGDKLVLEFDVPKAGRYNVLARFVKAIDYGIVQLSIDGKKAGDEIDLYNDGVIGSDEIDLGNHELTAGENRLSVDIIGANPNAKKAYMFGLDYLLLEPAK